MKLEVPLCSVDPLSHLLCYFLPFHLQELCFNGPPHPTKLKIRTCAGSRLACVNNMCVFPIFLFVTSLLADGFLSPSLVHYWFSRMNDPPNVDFPPSLVMLVMRLTTSTRPVGMAETSAIVSMMNPVITRPLHRTSPTTSLIILRPPFFWPPILALSSPPPDLSTRFPPDLFTTPFNILLGLPPNHHQHTPRFPGQDPS